jgi:hypothetical protein
VAVEFGLEVVADLEVQAEIEKILLDVDFEPEPKELVVVTVEHGVETANEWAVEVGIDFLADVANNFGVSLVEVGLKSQQVVCDLCTNKPSIGFLK